MISIPTHILGERVVCVFPVIGDDGFDEAEVVTIDQTNSYFTVDRYVPGARPDIIVGSEHTSFPDAIRHARKMAGWG